MIIIFAKVGTFENAIHSCAGLQLQVSLRIKNPFRVANFVETGASMLNPDSLDGTLYTEHVCITYDNI